MNNHFSAKSKHRNGEPRTYQELLQNKVEIIKVVRIERQYDLDDISYKWCDYSHATISQMIERGIHETLQEIVGREKQHPDFQMKNEIDKFIEILDKEKTSEGLTHKQTRILTQPAADILREAAIDALNRHTDT